MDATFQASEPINRYSSGLCHWSNALHVAVAIKPPKILRIHCYNATNLCYFTPFGSMEQRQTTSEDITHETNEYCDHLP